MLPHRTMLANLDGASQPRRRLNGDDVAVSWLPLYHDMGLIGLFTLPMVSGIDLVLASPQDFMASPARWLEWISAFGGTCTAGPELLLRARGARPAARRRTSTCRAGGSRSTARSRSTRRPCATSARRGARVRHVDRRRVPRVRHGRAGDRRHVPRSRAAACASTRSTPACVESDRYAAPVADEDAEGARRLRLARPSRSPDSRSASPIPETGSTMTRARSRRTRDPRHVGHARLLQAPEATDGDVPRRVAAHRRPRLPRRRRTRRCAAASRT